MGFNSLLFLIIFLPIFLLVFNLIPKKYRYLGVLVCSFIFYLYSGLFNFLLLLGICLVNYVLTNLFSKLNKKYLWYLLIILNVGVLGLFKYNKSLLFPLGISFYTFNNLSYIIDIKRGKIKVEKNILYYLTYIFLFCHLTMGPLVRYDDIKSKILNPNVKMDDFLDGYRLFIWNLVKKILIADNLGILYNSLMNSNDVSGLLNIVCLIVFGVQLYIDFSSYSNMVIGLGKMIGVEYPINFDYPYLSLSVSEFWRRWHISLGKFFKDYVYIPLGGNRVNKVRCIINLLIVWALTGIWHGNSINFLLWGLYYGVILILEKYVFKNILEKLPNFIKHIYVILVVFIGYIFFSISDFSMMSEFIKNIFSSRFINITIIFYLRENILLLIFGVILCFKLPKCIKELGNKPICMIVSNIILVVLYIISICYIVSGSYVPFLYNAF